eukprot:g2075.t1
MKRIRRLSAAKLRLDKIRGKEKEADVEPQNRKASEPPPRISSAAKSYAAIGARTKTGTANKKSTQKKLIKATTVANEKNTEQKSSKISKLAALRNRKSTTNGAALVPRKEKQEKKPTNMKVEKKKEKKRLEARPVTPPGTFRGFIRT